MKQVISTKEAPEAAGPYNQAITVDRTVYCSGQIAPEASDVVAQTQQALTQLQAVLQAAGSSLEQVVKTTVFMVDLSQFAAMNAVYSTMMPAPFPARSTIQVAALPKGALVEIECIATL